MSTEDKNRSYWDRTSDEYQTAHGRELAGKPLAWGVWRIPEAELRVLGDIDGLDTLELGCGAAQWTIALTRAGARAVGIDLSERQLDHARQASNREGMGTALVLGRAESLPFRNQSFDIVFCDHGATVFAPAELTIAEASRVLRPHGVFAFCMSTPIRDICWDARSDRISPELVGDYFGMHALEDNDSTCYQLPYGAWIRLFRRHSLEIEDLIELQAPEDATTTYTDYVPMDWARRWPAEHIWKLRKAERKRNSAAT